MRAAILIPVVALAFPSGGMRADDPPKGWDFVGRVHATSVDVRAQATGQLVKITTQEGVAVAKGDLLAQIDPRPYQLSLDAAQGRLKVAEAKLQVAKIAAANARRLLQNKVVSPDEVALHESAEAEATANLLVAKVEVQRAELSLSWTRVTAPIGGRVSRVQVSEGSVVTADQTHILTVVATDPLHVSFNVPQAIVTRLRRDGKAEPAKLDVAVGFDGEEGFPNAAKLDLIAVEVDPMTGTVRFQATFPNHMGFFSPGMTARVRLTPQAK